MGARSILLRDGNTFLKVFTSRDRQRRAERESGFYSQFKSPYIPSYIRLEYKQKFPVILFKLIRKSDPGFLSDEVMYDYATFWAWLHSNEEYLIRQFLKKEVPYMVSKGLWKSFSYCYLKRCEILKRYPESFNRGTKLRDKILFLIGRNDLC